MVMQELAIAINQPIDTHHPESISVAPRCIVRRGNRDVEIETVLAPYLHLNVHNVWVILVLGTVRFC